MVTTDDSGGVLEWVQDGVTGFVTLPAAAPLAEKLDELAADRSLCERQGMAGRERVQTEVSWPLAIEALTATLE